MNKINEIDQKEELYIPLKKKMENKIIKNENINIEGKKGWEERIYIEKDIIIIPGKVKKNEINNKESILIEGKNKIKWEDKREIETDIISIEKKYGFNENIVNIENFEFNYLKNSYRLNDIVDIQNQVMNFDGVKKLNWNDIIETELNNILDSKFFGSVFLKYYIYLWYFLCIII